MSDFFGSEANIVCELVTYTKEKNMKAENIPKEIFKSASKLGVNSINISLRSDGEIYVSLVAGKGDENHDSLQSEIESWAYEVYADYGSDDYVSDYGEEIEYDIKKKKVTVFSWGNKVENEEEVETKLEIE